MIAILWAVGVLFLAPLAAALGKGEFCFFLAPKELGGLGHIAWGFQIPGNGDLYQYGGTEDVNFGDVWTAQGTKQQMLAAFPGWVHQKWGNGYQVYKCISTDTSAVGAAEKVVQYQQTKANVYNVATNNCLTQALDIAQRYAEHDVYMAIVLQAGFWQNPLILIDPSVFWMYVPATEQRLPGQ